MLAKKKMKALITVRWIQLLPISVRWKNAQNIFWFLKGTINPVSVRNIFNSKPK